MRVNRIWLYRLLQFLGWGCYGLFLIISVWIWNPSGQINLRVVLLNIIIPLVCGLASHGLRILFHKYQWPQRPLAWMALRLPALALATALLSQAVIHVIIYGLLNFQELQPFTIRGFLFFTFNISIVFICWCGIYLGIKAIERNRRVELEQWKLKASLKDAELLALKAQINPHFLFNALNNIRALVLEDSEKARDMITHLSDLLRHSVQTNQSAKVPLRDEIEVVEHYLQLEGIQHEHRLSYSLEIAETLRDKMVPPMVLQMLVENAIKHGISQLPEGGKIIIRATQDLENLIVEVENTGKLNSSAEGLGIGLNNISDRVRLIFGQMATISLTETNHKSVLAKLQIPAQP